MKNFLINSILYLFVRFMHFSFRYEFYGREKLEELKKNNPFKTFVMAVWHKEVFTTLTAHIGTPFTMIISASKDGDIISNACQSFGHIPARGSSSRGGKEALLEVIRIMKTGYPAAMAVDGPRGPAHIVKFGVIQMARLTESAIVPIACYPKNFWCFQKSWDKFMLPKPFTKMAVVYGEPIYVPSEISDDELLQLSKLVAEKMFDAENFAKEKLGIN